MSSGTRSVCSLLPSCSARRVTHGPGHGIDSQLAEIMPSVLAQPDCTAMLECSKSAPVSMGR